MNKFQKDNLFKKNIWSHTRDSYTDWFAESKLKSFFSKKLSYMNLSLWWITKNADKDNTVENNWYHDLKILLNKEKKIIYDRKLFFFIFTGKLFKNFLRDIIFCLMIKLFFFTRFAKIKKKNCFYSIEIDLVQNGKLSYDRMYSHTPLKSKKNDNFYLVNVVNHFNFFKRIFYYKRLFSKLEIPYVISNEFITINQILKIHFFTLLCFFRLLLYLKKNKNLFIINKIDCSSVLKPLLLSSFSGSIQKSLIEGVSIKNYAKKNKFNFFINYIEFNPRSRSVYHFIKESKKNIKTISYQGSLCNENVLPYLHRAKEFTHKRGKEGGIYSPSPDFYFVQGKQFKKLLSSYFKKKVYIIGSLRYDLVEFKKINKKNKIIKKILVCPSVGDELMIIEYLKNLKNRNFKFFLSPHPLVFKKTLNLFKNKLSDDIKFETSNLNSFDMLNKVDFVISGLSSMALEANLSNIDSARITNPKFQNIFDPNDGVKILKNFEEIPELTRKNIIKEISASIRYLFYKLDQKAHIRFWKSIDEIKKFK